ncbi:MAG: family 43 glycosylhydrolase [Capsulimonadales bacterium]|nr:family 43 glycosylhydrolase [Capsulimonadales bacterium]
MMYTNPVWPKDFPDPFVIEWRKRFYAYATETPPYRFQVLESPDLVHWTHRGTAFTPPWAQEHYWAPEVVAYRNRLYFLYSALNPQTRKHDIAIAVGDHPVGPFQQSALLVRGDDNRVGVIDATIWFEAKVPYLIYSEEDPRRIVMRRMKDDLLGVEEEKVELVRPDRDWERGVTEAPTLIKRGRRYHLIYSAGWFQSNKQDASYCVAHAVAPKLTGPYVKTGQILTGDGKEVYGPGHQCYLKLRSGEEWLLYHGWDAQNEPRYGSNPLGRTLRLDRLEWSEDRPRVIVPSVTPLPAPRIVR